MYPFFIKEAEELRTLLISNNIYVPILWPNVINDCPCDSIEYMYANNIIPLPIDQRYSKNDMDIIFKIIKVFFEERGLK